MRNTFANICLHQVKARTRKISARSAGWTAALAACALGAANAADTYTWTGPAVYNGYMSWNENSGGYWSGGDSADASYPLPKDGADVVFDTTAQTVGNLALRLPTTATWPHRFNSIVHKGQMDKNFAFQRTDANVPLQLDAGGLTTDARLPQIGDNANPVPFELIASQTWKSSPSKSLDQGSYWYASFKAAEDIVWTLNGAQGIVLSGGNSDGFYGTVLSSAALWLCHTNQFGRLGTRGVTLTSELETPTLSPVPELVFGYLPGDTGTAECPTPITLNLLKKGSVSYHQRPFLGVYLHNGTQDAEVRLTGALSGTVADGCLELGETGGQVYNDVMWDLRNPGVYRSDQCRLVLAGDGSGLKPAEDGAMIVVSTVVALENENALGEGNAAFDVEVGSQQSSRGMGKMAPFLTGIVGRNGVTIGSSIFSALNQSDGSYAGKGRPFVVLIGADDASEVRYTGTLQTGSLRTSTPAWWLDERCPVMRFTAAEGGTARIEGYVHNPYHTQVIGRGDVVFSCETNRFYASTVDVRGGRLVLANAKALAQTDANNAQRQTPRCVNLGDDVPASHDVDLFFAGVWPEKKVGSGPGEITLGETDDGKAACRLTFARSPGAIDGVAVKKGDVIVVNSMWTCQKSVELYANGVWEVTNDDCTVWERVDWLDEVAEVTAGHGLRVHVKSGEQFGGRAFFLANYESEAHNTSDVCVFSFGGAYPLTFHDEAADQPDVGFLLGGAFMCKNPVVVTDNGSTGVSELGGTTADESVFAGAITNRKGRVMLSAAAGGTVRVTGDLVAAEGVEAVYAKTGAGTVDLTAAQNFTASGFALSGGTLKVTAAQSAGASLAWTVDSADGAGTLLVDGAVDWTDRAVTVTAPAKLKANASFTLARATGTMTGLPTVSGLGANWRVERSGNDLVARYSRPGMAIIVK